VHGRRDGHPAVFPRRHAHGLRVLRRHYPPVAAAVWPC
jgi:hypothetical protein